MEIQTIQSAIAGIHRINEFFALEEKQIVEKDSETVAEECVEQMAGGHSENKTADVPFVEFRDVTFGYDEHVDFKTSLRTLRTAGRRGFDPRKTGSGSPGGRETETVRLCRTDLPHGSGNGTRSDHAV